MTDVSEIQDASVDSAMETHNNYLGYYLYCAGNYHICRSYLKFILPEISSGDMVTGAYLRLYSNTPEAGNQTVKAHRILGDWTSQTLNWNNKPLFEEEALDLYKYTSNNAGRPILLDITRAVKDWYNGGVNNGIMIRNEYEVNGDGVYWASDIDDDYVAARPCIVITYANTSGLEGRFSYHIQAAGRNGTVHVNDYNGNLILVHQTMATGGSLMPASVQHVYNTNDRLTDLGYGYGWRLSLMQTMEEVTGPDVTYYRHTDSDGTAHYFYHDTDDNKWKDESDPKLVLILPSGAETGYTIMDESSHGRSVFNSEGRLVQVKDRNSNALTVTYEEGKIVRVTDGAGRHITLAYNTDGTGAKTTLSSITSPAGQTKYFTYDVAGNLAQITDIDGTVLYYAYGASTHALAGITCPDGYRLAYTYYEDSCRVRDIQEYGGTEAGGSLHISYDRNSTTYTDNKGRSVTRRFNDQGLPVCAYNSFGQATAGRYGANGQNTDCLTSVTRLQDSIVQLLADPIMENTICGWQHGCSSDWTGETPGVSTDRAKVGSHSLKLSSTGTEGYAWHSQSVTAVKGKTYTASAYVDADIQEAAASGSVRLAAKYTDGNGIEQNVFSEMLHASTNGFVRLYVTFALPSDAQSSVVTIVLNMAGVKGTAYFDEAQLEEGESANRVNLVDNGTFFRGDADGFTLEGSAEDGIVSTGDTVSASYRLPLAVTAAPGTVREAPDTAAVITQRPGKGAMLCGFCTVTDSAGNTWYHVRTREGNKGYILKSEATPYVANSQQFQTGRVNTASAVLRKNANPASTVMLWSIPQGTLMPVFSKLTGSDGNRWYRVGTSVGDNGQHTVYHGCIPASQVDIVSTHDTRLTQTVPEGVYGLGSHLLHFYGDAYETKRLTKTIPLSGNAGDCYMVNCWGKGTPLPESDNDTARRFGVELSFHRANGAVETHHTNFSGDILDWQFLSDVYVARQDYVSISVSYIYSRHLNDAYFTGLSLFREEFGQTFTYDDKDRVITAADAEKNTTTFEFSNSGDLVGITDPKGRRFDYEHDTNHNPVKGTSAAGLVYRLAYDSKGNVIRSGAAEASSTGTTGNGTWTDRTMTADQNHVQSVTDSTGASVSYTWDSSHDRLTRMTDGNSHHRDYTYDGAGRLSSVSQHVPGGTVAEMETKAYTYNSDRLTGIHHNGFDYTFEYNNFGALTKAKAATTELARYTYGENNGPLLRTDYADGSYVRTEYDSQDRPVRTYAKDAADVGEHPLDVYHYDRQGNLRQVDGLQSGRSYNLDYDLTGRLARMTDSDGCAYEYTYDKNNLITRLAYKNGQYTSETTYTYDEDGRESTMTIGSGASAATRTTTYDQYGRVTSRSWSGTGQPAMTCTYPSSGNRQSVLPEKVTTGGHEYAYTYDHNDNILSIVDKDLSTNLTKTEYYKYDEWNQLIREDSQSQDRTFLYEYDKGGNLTARKEYAYTSAETIVETPLHTSSSTYSTAWKDQLTSWDGDIISYNVCGCMASKESTIYTWAAGNQLAGVHNCHNTTYVYDDKGRRIRKTVDGSITEYRWMGVLLMSEAVDNIIQTYHYDANSNLIAMDINGELYRYIFSVQGDVLGLCDSLGNVVVRYSYDAWGNIKSISGALAGTVGNYNHFLYRGYYYDSETGMYYLETRYYDPKTCRFVKHDNYISTDQNITCYNMYTYCANNPVSRIDSNGTIWSEICEFVKTAVFEIGNNLENLSSAYASCGGIAAADGPLPFGDALGIIGATVLTAGAVSYGIYQAIQVSPKVISKTVNREKIIAIPVPSSTNIFRHGGTSLRNLTPREKDKYTGLSFSTIPLPGSAETTIEEINMTGCLIAVQDGLTHVSVRPLNGTMQDWIDSGRDSVWTKALKSVVRKWNGV